MPARDQPDTNTHRLRRRTFIGASGGVGATLLAGCTAESDRPGHDSADESTDGESSTDDNSSDENGSSGNFRLLISDLPADIGDFDSLDVSFDRARIFRAGGDDEAESTDNDGNGDTSAPATSEADDTTDDDEDEADGGTGDEETDGTGDDDDDTEETGNGSNGRGFFELDLEGATVDLTRVVGGKAMKVFDGELEAGRYNKIELYAVDIEGIVDGEVVEVKIPSEKLQIVKPFEVTEDEPVTFVFDINVVKKGHGGYNLLPVISKSGIVGEDVEVDEIEPEDGNETVDDDTVEEDDEADDDAEDDGEQPDAPGQDDSNDSEEDN